MILLDGPMGTELTRRGVETPAPTWSAGALRTAPEIVEAIHAEHAAAGAEVHRTNTFRTQPRLFPDAFRDLVGVAVDRARAGARGGRFPGRVFGSVAPIADCYRPDLAPPPDEARPLHRALVGALVDAGVDGIVCETFPDPIEAVVAVSEAAASGLDVWAALTAGPDGSLLSPEALEAAARDCVRAGASAVLVCCTGASRTLPYVDRLARIGVPFGAYANAGELEERLGWGAEGAPTRYAEVADQWIDAGATIVGSCCGTSPEHIRALASRIALG